MAKKKKAQSPVEKAYNRERNRIKRFIREAEKRGYRFSDFSIPDKPKKITEASVRRLQKYNPKYLYEKATFLNPQTGEIVSGQRGRQIERKESARKAKETRRIKRIYDNLTPEEIAEREARQMERHLRGEDTEEYRKQKDEEIQRLQDELAELQERLRKLTGEEPDEDILEEPDTPDYETAESIKERIERGDYVPDEADMIIDNVIDDIEYMSTLAGVEEQIDNWQPLANWTPSLEAAKRHDRSVLMSTLAGAIMSEGRDAVARRLKEKAEEINSLVTEILYASGSKEGNFKDGRTQVNEDLNRFSAIIMGRPLNLEESKRLTEISEKAELEN